MAVDLSIFNNALFNFELASGFKPLILLGITALATVAITRDSREIKVLLFPIYTFFAISGRQYYLLSDQWPVTSLILLTLMLIWALNVLQVNTFSNIITTNNIFRTPLTKKAKIQRTAEAAVLRKQASVTARHLYATTPEGQLERYHTTEKFNKPTLIVEPPPSLYERVTAHMKTKKTGDKK